MAPVTSSIIGFKHIHVRRFYETSAGKFWVEGRYKGSKMCPYCSSKRLHSRGRYFRNLKHTRCGNRLVMIRLELRKFRCLKCRRNFNQRVENVQPRRRATENYRMEVYELHNGGFTQKMLSKTHKVSTSTVERWYWDFTRYRIQEMKARPSPKILGIDEHFFTRKKGYATSFVDLKNHKVFDVVLGRSEKSLEGYLQRLKGKEKTKVVVMDLSETYRSIVKKHFPNAMIVSDRFHVVKLVQHHFQKLWGQVDPHGRKNRGLLSLFRRNRMNMNEEQREKLESYFQKVPSVGVFDELQQKLLGLLRIKGINKSKARELIPELLECVLRLKESGLETLQTLGRTIESWLEPIGRMWRFRKTNSITEGFHTKMEMISRRAYGFRNFNNYRLRVIAHCGWDGLFNRF